MSHFFRVTLAIGFGVLCSALSQTASAYKEGTYFCQSGEVGLPKNEYKFTTVSFAGSSLPLVEVKRSYRQDSNNLSSPLVTTNLKGFGTIAKAGDQETIMLGYLRFEFQGDELLNCKP